ncbi:hypothetical protein [Algoriphagus chordae]|uniref:Tetratricopeptide repeat protein n=1 Tax=Algoriphagus chordae TaxID=237019 RepID=A0A2W7R1E5_9BACT|nr:hypothetical protein [Algoriphagus chordae]PZX52060.1 hypothetical protein LV85_02210 [Algoriphagus chordae]
MNKEQLKKDIFPAELMLQLFRDIPDVESKIRMVNEYIEKVHGVYDEDVLLIKQQNQIAHIYWISEQHEQSIHHFEIVVESMEVEDYPSLYFLALNLLIRGNRILSNYKAAEKWVALAFESSGIFNPAENLINLNDYADLLTESGKVFENKHMPLIQSIIDEYGFPEKLEDPITTIRSMRKSYQYWARKLGEMELKSAESSLTDNILAYENYTKSCEIGWFRNYASNSLDRLKSK